MVIQQADMQCKQLIFRSLSTLLKNYFKIFLKKISQNIFLILI